MYIKLQVDKDKMRKKRRNVPRVTDWDFGDIKMSGFRKRYLSVMKFSKSESRVRVPSSSPSPKPFQNMKRLKHEEI